MRMQPVVVLGLAAVVLAANTGCFARWRRLRENPPPRTYHDPVLPGQRPGGASPEILMPGANSGPPNGNGIPALPPPGVSGYRPTDTTFDPRNPSRSLPNTPYIPPTQTETSEPPIARPGANGVTLLPPDLRDPPRTELPGISEGSGKSAIPDLPVGIAGFAEIKPQVATGQRPDLDGLDWLRANRFRTVVHLFKPGAASTADREVVERRGLKYVPLELTPETLSLSQVEKFSQTIDSLLDAPVFVYDNNGLLNGTMWYLYFHLTEKQPDTAARKKAAALGLRETGSAEATAWWLAIQKVLTGAK